jgi:amino acid transporter
MQAESSFVRVLGRRDVLTLAFGAMIGWSWIVLTAEWIGRAGWLGAVCAFLLGGAAMIFIGLTYAELAAAMPEAGGEHVYSLRALGPGWSFVCTWALLLAYISVAAFEAVALPTALSYLVPGIRQGPLWTIGGWQVYASEIAVGAGASILITAVNLRGVRLAAAVQAIVTLVILLAGMLLATGAFFSPLESVTLPAFANGSEGLLGVLVMVPMMFVGFDVIPQSAEEVDLPLHAIGVLLIAAVLMAIAWYVLVIVAVAFTLDGEELARASLATADAGARAWGSPIAGRVVVLAGVAGILSSWNAFVVGGSRAMYALAHSGMLPPVLARLHPRHRTPWAAITLIGLLASIAPFFGRTAMVWFVDAGSFAVVIAYLLVAVSFLKLRRADPEMPRPYRVARGGFVGWAAVVLSVLLSLLYLPGSPVALIWPFEWAMVLGWTLLGAALYLMRGSRF